MVLEIWSATDKNLLFWTIFCPFTPLTTQKIKILKKNEKKKKKKKTKKKKKKLEDIIIHMCIINENHMMYGS